MARLPYLNLENLSPEQRARIQLVVGPNGTVGRPFQVLLHSPEAAARYLSLSNYSREASSIDPQTREMVILATAREWNSQFIWTAHEGLARRVGVDEHIITAIRDRKAPRGLLPKDAVFVQFTQELLRDRKVGDTTFQAVEHLVGPRGVVDLTLLVGSYTMQAHTLAALEVDLDDGVQPLLPV